MTLPVCYRLMCERGWINFVANSTPKPKHQLLS